MHVFISYASEDRHYARRLAEYLEVAGVPVWIDDAIRPGEDWVQAVRNAINEAAALVVVITPAAQKSKKVEQELVAAAAISKPVAPFLVAGEPLGRLRHEKHYTTEHRGRPSPELAFRLRDLVAEGSLGRDFVRRFFPNVVRRISERHGITYAHLDNLYSEEDRVDWTGPASPAAPSIQTDAFLDTDDSAVAAKVFAALDEVAQALGYEGPVDVELHRGSFFRRARAVLKNAVGSEEVRARLTKMERALELAGLDSRQADVDLKASQAIGNLIASLRDVPRACLRSGSILLIKYDGNDGPVILTRCLSQHEIHTLDKYPGIQKDPLRVLELLALAMEGREVENYSPNELDQD
jgi:nucleotide-binding universal stress UspA family protein